MNIQAETRHMDWGGRMVSVSLLELCAARLLRHVEVCVERQGLGSPAEAQALRHEMEDVFGQRPDAEAKQ